LNSLFSNNHFAEFIDSDDLLTQVAHGLKAILDAADLELAGSRVEGGGLTTDEVSDTGSWEQALAAFEKALLKRLYPLYPSSRKLAAHLRTSHTTVANKLRKYGIGNRQ
jgi:TyrR family helix-turn-helix protein